MSIGGSLTESLQVTGEKSLEVSPPNVFASLANVSLRKLNYAQVRESFQELRNNPEISHMHLLLNGMTAGEFCLYHLLSGKVPGDMTNHTNHTNMDAKNHGKHDTMQDTSNPKKRRITNSEAKSTQRLDFQSPQALKPQCRIPLPLSNSDGSDESKRRNAIIPNMSLKKERACLRELRTLSNAIQPTTMLTQCKMSAGEFAFIYTMNKIKQRLVKYKTKNR